ncbi:MAG: DUF4094 domain-containing protein [Oscillospiraceae bacterium]
MDKEINAEKKSTGRCSLCADMFLSFIITFAAGVFCYENYMPQQFMSIYRFAVIAVCIITWLGLSFSSGVRKRWQYEVFTVLFWLLPPLIIYLANEGPKFCRMSITMYLLSEFAEFISTAPALLVGSFADLGAVPCVFVILLLCIFAFLAGMLFSSEFSKKHPSSLNR